MYSIWKDQKAAATIEGSVSIGVFFYIILLSIEVLLLTYYALTSQFLVSRIVRYAVLQNEPSGGATRTEDIRNSLEVLASTYGLHLDANDSSQVKVCNLTPSDGSIASPGCATQDAGAPEDMISLELHVPFRVAALGGTTFTINALAVGRNEPAKKLPST